MMVCARFAAKAVAVGAFLAGVTGATALGSISYSYGTNQTSTNYSPGAPITLEVYLVETLTAGSTSLIASAGGLDSAAFKVSRISGTATISGLTFNSVSAFDAGAPHNAIVNDGTVATLTESTNFGSPGVGLLTNDNKVLLGTISFLAPSTAGTTSTFNLQRYKDTGVNTFTSEFNNLDFSSTSPAYTGATGVSTITIVTVPEPVSVGLLAVGLPVLALRRRARSA